MKKMEKKKYTPEERFQIREKYFETFDELPHIPRGCRCEITDLMEVAIERGEPLKFAEYESRIKPIKHKDGVVY